ncbi:PAS domain-containing sensor histidine kinase [Flavobacterium sp.]|uniref:sensor histidine kinase n=1 Tax=Flavobacterium sp. TaxID=239 RepID=UPI00286E245E|nr:PAS domain-containing sensor histidine kinase [Flavobacterium sp.]
MNVSLMDNVENEYLKKIIGKQTNVFFQFVLSSENAIEFNYLNGAVVDIFELSIEQVRISPKLILEDSIHAEDSIRFKNSIFKAFNSLGKFELDYRIILPSQKIKWVRVSAETEKAENGGVAFYGTMSDISSIKEKEEDFKIFEARSHFANLASGIGVWDWDMVTNKVFYSTQSLKILELDDSDFDLIDNPEKWDDRVHPDDREAYFGNINLHFEGKTPYYETYHRILCYGKYKWILDRGKVISRDVNGKPLRIIGTHTDVSAQKDREEKLEETLGLINEQKNKLLNFAYIVSHNLKNHTSNLSLLLHTFDNDILTANELMPNIRIISKELNGTIENLVELVSIQTNSQINSQNLVVSDYLNKVFVVLNDEIIKNNILIVNTVPKDFNVNCIPAYLESIFLNLTTNAIKYLRKSQQSTIEFYIENKDDYKVLCVKDNGLGIDLVKYKDLIFGMYKTFHKHKDSTGIGLHITKNQIEAMGGKIELESEVNVGSIFKVYFK